MASTFLILKGLIKFLLLGLFAYFIGYSRGKYGKNKDGNKWIDDIFKSKNNKK